MAEEVTWQSWSLGNGKEHHKAQHWPVLAEDAKVGEYIRADDHDTIVTEAGTWRIDSDADHQLTATLPDGRIFTTTATDRKKIARAKQLTVEFGGETAPASVVCEGSTNYVIENKSTGEKWGQFTGASRGVRHAEIQFDTEEGRALADDQKIFLVYSARRILEARMVSTTIILSICLLLLIAYILRAWLV